MITTSRKQRKAPPVPKRLSLRQWQKGKVSGDGNRIPKDGLKTALNSMLKQNGTAGPMPGRVLYGTQPVGTVLGEIAEFTRRVGGTTQNYEISVQNVSGTAKVYYRKDGGSWTEASGKTYDTDARVHFCPIRDIDDDYNDEDKVLILNGEDNLSYLDINTLTVIPFVTLPATIAPSVTVGAGLTGTNFPQRYRVTAGNRGETAASIASAVTTSKPRSEWSGATEYVDVQISRVSGAERYHIYYGTETGAEVYLFSIDDPTPHNGSGTVTWRDSGVVDPNICRPAPAGDTTSGPIGTRASSINGQVFIVGDKVNPKYVRYGGTGKSILDFSPYGGGGYEPVGGNKEIPVKVAPFRKNDGTPAVTALCKGTNGFGKRYIMTPTAIGNVSYFAISEENGNDGTEAPDSVILAKDQLWYLSKDGPKTTLTKAQVQTILSTENVGDNIQDDIARWNSDTLDLSWGVHYEGRNYWGVAAGSATNNQIMVLDLNENRRGAWMGPWEVPADWGWLYNDNDGNTHFCTLENNQILEFTQSAATQANGVAFPTELETGIMGFSDDLQMWAILLRLIVVLQRPQGTINVRITGKTEDAPITALSSEPYTADSSIAGWGENLGWSHMYGWGGTNTIPETFGEERKEIPLEIDEELNWFKVNISSILANTDYEVTDIIAEYIETGVKR